MGHRAETTQLQTRIPVLWRFINDAKTVQTSLLTFQSYNTNICLFFQENGLSFSLEAVKRLQELAEIRGSMGQQSPRLKASTMSLCVDPMLPQELLPICKQRGASASLARLGETIKNWWDFKWNLQVMNNKVQVIQQCLMSVANLSSFYCSNGSPGCLWDLCLCCLHWLLNKPSKPEASCQA